MTIGGSVYASERPDKNGNVRRAVLRDGLYRVPVAVQARICDGVDVRDELDGVSFAAAPDVHGNFNLYFNGSGRLAGFRQWRGLKQIARTGRRILFRVVAGLCAVEFFQGRDAEFETLRADEYFNRGADNVYWRLNIDDFNFARGTLAGVDNGGLPVHFRRRVKSDGGGIFGREVAKNFGEVTDFDCGENN